MIQSSHYQRQIQANAVITPSIPYQNKAIISLEDLLIGYLTREDDNKMTVLNKNGPLEYQDLLRYRVDDRQSSYDGHNSNIIG
jgi:hypothetical protein